MNVRRDKLLKRIDPARQRGLEIGPLDKPIVGRADGDVRYVDFTDADELRRRHVGTPGVDPARIVDVDYIWGARRLAEEIGSTERFEYVIASHVVEHVPDLIGWFDELAEILRPGGLLSFIVPDKRYTFDRLRPTTEVPELVDAHLERRRKPSMKQVFEHYARHTRVDAAMAWAGTLDEATLERVHDERFALEVCREAMTSGRYVDAHCWVFTPRSFLDLLRVLAEMGLGVFRVVEFFPTVRGEIDFFVTLERLHDELDPGERRAVQLASLMGCRAEGDVPGFGPWSRAVDSGHGWTARLLRRAAAPVLASVRAVGAGTSRRWKTMKRYRPVVRS